MDAGDRLVRRRSRPQPRCEATLVVAEARRGRYRRDRVTPRDAPRRRERIATWAVAGLFACGDAEQVSIAREPSSPATELTAAATMLDLAGAAIDPLVAFPTHTHVFAFVTPDCPLSNRYAPELARIAAGAGADAKWWTVYPDPDVDADAAREHHREYGLPGTPLRDPFHALVAKVAAKVTPEVAVFAPSPGGPSLAYHGRIDDRVPEFGRSKPQPTRRELDDVLAAIAAGAKPPTDHAQAVGCPIGDLR
jgi:hypothetical protein